MKINRYIEAIIVALLYLTALYFWTLPIQQNPLPYGEVDAASHYAVADYTLSLDRSIEILPDYIDMRYGRDNTFKEHVLWYPPPFHMGLATGGFLGGSSTVPVYLTNAVFCLLIILSVYFVVRRLFGFKAALLSGILLMFSIRDILIYIWGQWPERMAFAYVPLVLYSFYQYVMSFIKGKPNTIYLYLMSILLALNLFIHPMVFFHTLLGLILFSLFILIREKKIFFSIKHMAIVVVLFFLIISMFPYQTLNVLGRSQDSGANPAEKGDFSRFFSWFKPPQNNPGVPDSYFSYRDMIGPLWSILFLVLGIALLLLRRSSKDLLLLAWLASLYIMIHLDVFGTGRVHRSLSGTAHIFYPLMSIGLLYALSFLPALGKWRGHLQNGAIIVFAVLLLSATGPSAQGFLEGAYQGVGRINGHQSEYTEWLRSSDLEEDASFVHVGSLSLAKTRWLWMIGHRYHYPSTIQAEAPPIYTVIDLSDFALIRDQQSIAALQNLELTFSNKTAVYESEFIRVYRN
ncbi:hypothetical protein GOV09_02215 [Candidatus Woesearchaeota archaeon]|nr:hypothetical protein [Candidatus Woesearchaeota archaeon]